jgi:tRNA(fMet)-specific endonuclease VapC
VIRTLLDTDIFSEILKGVNQQVFTRAAAYQAVYGQYTISSMTVMEIVKGFHKLQREDRIQRLLRMLPSLEVLTIDASVAEIAGRIYADLERVGQPIGRIDPLIAACALQHGLTLVTGNTAHHARVQTLGYSIQLDNWRNEGPSVQI